MIRRLSYLLSFPCSLFLMIGCGNETPEKTVVKAEPIDSVLNVATIFSTHPDTAPHSFAQFIAQFKLVTLPLEFSPNEPGIGLLKQSDEKDAAFIEIMPCNYFALLPDTSRFYAVITILPGDDLIPELITYNKKGKRISTKILGLIGTGGFLCGSTSRQVYRIGSDLSIFCSDSVTANICDPSSGQPTTFSAYNKTITGRIQTDGKIVTEEKGNFP